MSPVSTTPMFRLANSFRYLLCLIAWISVVQVQVAQSAGNSLDSLSLEIFASTVTNEAQFFEAIRDSNWHLDLLSPRITESRHILLGEGRWIIERYFNGNDNGYKVYIDQSRNKGYVLAYGRNAENISVENIERMLKSNHAYFNPWSEDSLVTFLSDLIMAPSVHLYHWENGCYIKTKRQFCEFDWNYRIDTCRETSINGRLRCFSGRQWMDAQEVWGGLRPSYIEIQRKRKRIKLLCNGKHWGRYQFFYSDAFMGYQFRFRFKSYFPFYLL